ncbi:MAG: NADH-quinone oxidoreductase subunit J [Candidatus Paracaedibacteraceae bacterium]|nr:NADH-quinone oxidoreductase subunit J [Candidatus Paracaedibacteraceae bacterium]
MFSNIVKIMAVFILFIVFSMCLLGAASVVVFSKNTLYSALALIVVFFNAAAIILMSGAEFLSFVLMIVYVGAVAVLFLFIIMMLNLKKNEFEISYGPYLYSALGVALLLIAEIIAAAYFFTEHPNALDLLVSPRQSRVQNVVALGQILYTHYAYIFQVGGLILFVAMIGAIVLTTGARRIVPNRTQNVSKQNQRSKENSLVITSPKSGEGIASETINQYQAAKNLS